MNKAKRGDVVVTDVFYGIIIKGLLVFERQGVSPTDDELWIEILSHHNASRFDTKGIRYFIRNGNRHSKSCKIKLFVVTQDSPVTARRISVDWKGIAEELWVRTVNPGADLLYCQPPAYREQYTKDLSAADAASLGEILRIIANRLAENKANFSVIDLFTCFRAVWSTYYSYFQRLKNTNGWDEDCFFRRLSEETLRTLTMISDPPRMRKSLSVAVQPKKPLPEPFCRLCDAEENHSFAVCEKYHPQLGDRVTLVQR